MTTYVGITEHPPQLCQTSNKRAPVRDPVRADPVEQRHHTPGHPCLVRDQRLALSLQHWDIGQHGIWGGLVPADRAGQALRLSR
jgi:hypothetical protein